jgi:multimeric flavodoxin WrbA
MKILGLSFGRKNRNSDILVKEALLGAKEAGAEIAFLNMMDKQIGHCTGCAACDRRREKGGPSRCIIKDDFPFVEDAILEADGIIVAAPVYVLGPIGQYKNLVDRMGPSHDRSQMERENAKRIAQGKTGEELLDPRLFKDRFLGMISVGGARTENWTSMGLPNMHLFSFSMQMNVVDHYNAYRMGDIVNPLFDDELLARMRQMGRSVAESIGTPRLEAEWKGDKPGICPLCHNDLLTIKTGTTVVCPICGMEGTLSIEDGQIKATFTEEQIERSRQRQGGVDDHMDEIASFGPIVQAKLAESGHLLPEKMKRFDGIRELDKKDFVENMKQ